MTHALDRGLVAFGQHVKASDPFYWVCALSAAAVGVGLGFLTGLWGLAGMTLAAFAFVALTARRRYERSQAG